MKEQVQLPWSDKGSNDEKSKENKPKAIGRPMIAEGLDKPRIKDAPAFQRCEVCSDPRCNAPQFDDSCAWNYFDQDNKQIVGYLPLNGPRFLPGS